MWAYRNVRPVRRFAAGCNTLRRAFFLVLPNLHILDLAGPLQIVATLPEMGIAQVQAQCIGPQSNLRCYQDAALGEVAPMPERLAQGDALFVVGSKVDDALTASAPWKEAVAWLRAQKGCLPPGVPVCGICTGSRLLGEAGFLDGRTCTCHHRFIADMRGMFPLANLVESRVWCRDGPVWTSAGVTAGIDLALQWVAAEFGSEAAMLAARENVVDFRRFSDDPELAGAFRHRRHGNQLIHKVQDALEKTFTSGISCQAVADGFGLSYRQLARQFSDETGVSMKRYQLTLRLEMAQELLQNSAAAVEVVALQCGFSSVQAFRNNWDKQGLPLPSAMRKTEAQ